MRKLLTIAALAVLLTSCDDRAARRQRPHYEKKPEKVYHLADGRYAYQGSDGFWFYYMLLSTNGNTSYYSTTYVAGSRAATSSMPSGGVWASVPTTSVAPVIPEGEEPEVEQVAVQPNGEPITETQEMEQMEFDFDAPAAEPASEAPAAESTSGESSGGESSSSGDSGGGGDGGGSSD